jgi:hypothetical protein
MSQGINGLTIVDFRNDPELDPIGVITRIPAYSKTASVPNPSQIFLFIDEHSQTMLDAQFGYPTDGRMMWFDMPSGRHSPNLTRDNISFTEGHIESWRWKFPKKFNGDLGQPIGPIEAPDFRRVGDALRKTMK